MAITWRRYGDRALALVGALVVVPGRSATAQAVTPALSVRPREMATATHTVRAGRQTLDGTPDSTLKVLNPAGLGMVYVPEPCVGARRCPLVIMSNVPDRYYIHIADKYAMIVASLKASWDTAKAATFDREIQQVLRTFAIDPEKIAILGRCATGDATAAYAAHNPGLFSLVVVGTEHPGDPPVKSPDQKTEYFIAGGMMENAGSFWNVRRQLRDRGYNVTHSLQFRGHTHTYEEYDFMGRWMQERWAIPDPAARPVPPTLDKPPLLTTEILARMTAFWARFMEEPESIKTTARQALVREVLIPVGRERVSTLMVDMPALARKYPSVAAALRAAKLTPEEHETYRAAIAGTRIYRNGLQQRNPFSLFAIPKEITTDSIRAFLGVDTTSVLAQNWAFMNAHLDEFKELEATKMFVTP